MAGMLWAPVSLWLARNICLQASVTKGKGLLPSWVSHGSELWWRKIKEYARDSILSWWLNCRPWWLLTKANVEVPMRNRFSCIKMWMQDVESQYFCAMPKLMRKIVFSESPTFVRMLCGLMSQWMKLWEWMYSRRKICYDKVSRPMTTTGWDSTRKLTSWRPIFATWERLNALENCRNKLCKEDPRLSRTIAQYAPSLPSQIGHGSPGIVSAQSSLSIRYSCYKYDLVLLLHGSSLTATSWPVKMFCKW